MENSIRKELHEMIDNFSDERLLEVYELLQEDGEYADKFKKMLDEEYEDYQQTGNAVSKEEVDTIIQAILTKK